MITAMSWYPRSTRATVVYWVARAVVLLPMLYFVFMAMASLACFSDSCRDPGHRISYALIATVASLLLGWTPNAAVAVLQRAGTAPTTTRVVAVLAGYTVLVWGVFTAFIVYFIKATGV
jgi:hypothetical protein